MLTSLPHVEPAFSFFAFSEVVRGDVIPLLYAPHFSARRACLWVITCVMSIITRRPRRFRIGAIRTPLSSPSDAISFIPVLSIAHEPASTNVNWIYVCTNNFVFACMGRKKCRNGLLTEREHCPLRLPRQHSTTCLQHLSISNNYNNL